LSWDVQTGGLQLFFEHQNLRHKAKKKRKHRNRMNESFASKKFEKEKPETFL
jgi:hypothetical protein